MRKSPPPFTGAFDVKKFGAKGDGKALDSPAINKAIDAAAWFFIRHMKGLQGSLLPDQR